MIKMCETEVIIFEATNVAIETSYFSSDFSDYPKTMEDSFEITACTSNVITVVADLKT